MVLTASIYDLLKPEGGGGKLCSYSKFNNEYLKRHLKCEGQPKSKYDSRHYATTVNEMQQNLREI